jgi:hypothetical protein
VIFRQPFLLMAFFVCLLSSPGSRAQGPCSTTSTTNKVACTVPQLYGPQGLVVSLSQGPLNSGLGNNGNAALLGSFSQDLSPLNLSLATQLSFLPLPSPSSGITFTFDRALGVSVLSNDSFAPVFSEGGRTIGRHRLAIGFSYQYSKFDSLDGVNLRSFPTVYLRGDVSVPALNPDQQPFTCSINAPSPGPLNTGYCALVRDYITATNSIDLNLSQYTAFVTFGLTNRVDLSAAIPIESVHMSADSSAMIIQQSLSSAAYFYGAKSSPANPPCQALLPLRESGVCTANTFSNRNSAFGIGDLTLRAKGTIIKGERSDLALGLDVRLPTGDDTNFLGSGAFGIKPFAAWSYSWRISPHFDVGYGWNGKSLLAGDVVTGTEAHLPSEVFYSAGFEAAILRRLTATVDIIGQRLFNAERIELSSVSTPGLCDTYPGYNTDGTAPPPGGCLNPGPPGQAPSITQSSGSYGMTNASVGLRYNPFGRLLLTANCQFKLDDGGLRAKYLPSVSAIYTFR